MTASQCWDYNSSVRQWTWMKRLLLWFQVSKLPKYLTGILIKEGERSKKRFGDWERRLKKKSRKSRRPRGKLKWPSCLCRSNRFKINRYRRKQWCWPKNDRTPFSRSLIFWVKSCKSATWSTPKLRNSTSNQGRYTPKILMTSKKIPNLKKFLNMKSVWREEFTSQSVSTR